MIDPQLLRKDIAAVAARVRVCKDLRSDSKVLNFSTSS